MVNPPDKRGGVRAVAEMLGGLDAEMRNKILANVAARDPRLATEIREKLFTFEDLPKVSAADMQKALRAIGDEKLALALRNAPQEVVEWVMKNLSSRTRERLNEEMKNLGPRRVSEIEKARAELVKLVKGSS